MATHVPPKPKSMTLVFAPKVQKQTRVLSIAQRQLSTRQLRRLLVVPIGGTILMTSPRRLRACRLRNKELRSQIPLIPLRAPRASYCTTGSVVWTSIRAEPDPRPRHPVPLAPEARLHVMLERRQRPSSVKRVVFIPVEAWQTNTS